MSTNSALRNEYADFLRKAEEVLASLNRDMFNNEVKATITVEIPRIGDLLLSEGQPGSTPIPAAACSPCAGVIYIHPYIATHQRTPIYVLRYLLAHECLHFVIPSSDDNPHPPALVERDMALPKRDMATAWLQSKGFPVPIW